MLEWLKTILGENYTEEIDKKVSAEIGKGFVAKTDFNAKNEALKKLEGQLKDRDNQLVELKKVDTSKHQEEIDRLRGENKTAKESCDSKIKQLELNIHAKELSVVFPEGTKVEEKKEILQAFLESQRG